MESSPSALFKLLVPKAPFLLKTALLHTLSFSDTASKWDLRTELTVKMLREMLGPNARPTPIGKQQRMTIKDPGVKGNVWVSKVRFEVDGEGGEGDGQRDEVKDVVVKAVEEMGSGEEKFTVPESKALEAEWTGYRAGAAPNEPEPAGLIEAQKYEELMKEVTNPVTLLYFHGGAMYLLDPATYRPVTGKLARLTGGRVFSVRYRLSPQNPFPAALVDALHAYLALLYPPPGSYHTPILASEIVVGGDSAGGLLSTALLQLLLHLHRTKPSDQTLPKIRFHGKDVEVPLPAGLALTSPWLDVTRSLPSIESGVKYDYLPPPSHTSRKSPPADECWPANPPRADMYAEGSALCHPLVSTLAAKDWTGSPPIFIVTGEEMLSDEDAVFAQRLAKQGIRVNWWQFEAMPHCFGMMMEWLGESRLCFDTYANFCKNVVEMKGQVETEGWFVEAKTLMKRKIEMKEMSKLADEEVERLMREGRERLEKKVGTVTAMPKI
ncbi:acetyl-hydrolase [Delitschia confertaspora ATCC 74209]|uniref:Acetyl-hydrolase n=1 Tax=Delitschia confertaspora ATCC 74209 TaxID=1513339 RepID=A0A9P4JN46_9PLEO|nr:acetyl-hydrolase [Delitschia confertaspora ATCC 74209]